MESESKQSVAAVGGNSVSQYIILNKELRSLISSVKNMQIITTLQEVLDGLKIYICTKKLFDPCDPTRIYCKDDELGSVLGVTEFRVFDVRNLLQKLVSPVSCLDSSEAVSTNSVSGNSSKRKFDEEEETNKKFCKCSPSKKSASPIFLYIPPSPTYNSKSDSPESIQGYETEYVKDTSDTVWSSEEDFLTAGRILAIEETYNLEYEVETDFSSDDDDDDCALSETDSDEEAVLNTAIITLLCRTDSDMEFWADDSSEDTDYDEEISESDQWQCSQCSIFNKPLYRFCLKCCHPRQGWLPEERRVPPKNKRKRKKASMNAVDKKEVEDMDSSVQDATSSQYSSQEIQDSKTCIICCSKPANASIIHGKFAHQISCYGCARKLQKKKKRCPICRRTIDKVVHQISAM